MKLVSTLIKPETPPILGSPPKPLIKLTRPCLPGVVPTSNRTQNYGFKYLQKPSKNHKWDDNLVPFVCLKQEKTLRPSWESYGFLWSESGKYVLDGLHIFW